jgi:hypothetical protein
METQRIIWVPEAPDHPGLYANESELSNVGKLQPIFLQPSTVHIHLARQFGTQQECQAWCDANPVPEFVATQHIIL